MRRIRGLVALSVGLALLAAACGGDQKHSNSALPKAPEAQNAAPDSGAPAASAPAAAPSEAAPAAGPATPAPGGGATAAAPAASSAAPAPAATKSKAPAARSSAAASPSATPGPGAPGTPQPGTPSAPATPAPGGGGGSVVSGTGNAPAGGNGGATDVGVSATEIKLGTISDNGAPLGNIVTIPVVTTVIGMMRAVNDTGGIYGGKVVVQDCAAAGDLTRFRSSFKNPVEEQQVL